jgi:hypothetical protein
MSERKPKRDRHIDSMGTDAMFDVEPMRLTRTRIKTVPSSAQGKCPTCTRAKIGLIAMGTHLVWRLHTYTTWSGARMTCAASGVAVCQLPERVPLNGVTTVTCLHDSPDQPERAL